MFTNDLNHGLPDSTDSFDLLCLSVSSAASVVLRSFVTIRAIGVSFSWMEWSCFPLR